MLSKNFQEETSLSFQPPAPLVVAHGLLASVWFVIDVQTTTDNINDESRFVMTFHIENCRFEETENISYYANFPNILGSHPLCFKSFMAINVLLNYSKAVVD